jgi:hypothetical protein
MFRVLGTYLDGISIIRVGYYKVKNSILNP